MFVEDSPISFAYAVLTVCLVGFVAEASVIYEGRKIAKLSEKPNESEEKSENRNSEKSQSRKSGISF